MSVEQSRREIRWRNLSNVRNNNALDDLIQKQGQSHSCDCRRKCNVTPFPKTIYPYMSLKKSFPVKVNVFGNWYILIQGTQTEWILNLFCVCVAWKPSQKTVEPNGWYLFGKIPFKIIRFLLKGSLLSLWLFHEKISTLCTTSFFENGLP